MKNHKSYSFREKILLVVLFFSALFSLYFFLRFHTLAFPEHNINSQISRDDAADKAAVFLNGMGLDSIKYKQSTIFSIDEQAKTYLEREVGVEETARLAKNQVDIWHFTTRFFKPLQKQEYNVSFLPNGKLSGFGKIVEETAPGGSPSRDNARKIAEKFLSNKIKIDLSSLKLISLNMIQRPKRTDYTIVWEIKNFKAKDATYRYEVSLIGSQIGSYGEFLKIPESWLRQYDKETANNELAQTIAESVMYLLFGISLIIFYIVKYRKNDLRFRPGWLLMGIAVFISILNDLNSIPVSMFNYPTTSSWDSFIGRQIINNIIESLSVGFMVFIIVTVGESLYREIFPDGISLDYILSHGIKSKAVNKSIFIGTFTAVILFSYEIAYYLIGKKFGIWTPAEVNYSDAYSTLIPWIYPLLVGFLAAVNEEGLFRFYGIPLLKKFTGKTWIAVLVTSVTWAFLHSNYPQTPWFARGIELTMTGLIFGFIFLRYGIVSSFVAHYTYNALQTTIAFISSHNYYVILSSFLITFLPLLYALYIYFTKRNKGFPLPDEHASNKTLHPPKKPAAQNSFAGIPIDNGSYSPLSRAKIIILVLLAVLSILIPAAVRQNVTINAIPTAINRADAEAMAKKALQKNGINTSGFIVTLKYIDNAIDNQASEYILQKSGLEELKRVYTGKLPSSYFIIRFFRPLQKEEYFVYVLPNGIIYSTAHLLDEKAPGADLSQAEAQKIAENYLVKTQEYNLRDYHIVSSNKDKKAARTDYTFTFENKKDKIAEAAFRTDVNISGNLTTGYSQYIKLPEKWIREKNQTTTKNLIVMIIFFISSLALSIMVLGTFMQNVRNKSIQFKNAFRISALFLILSIILWLNELPVFYFNYPTTSPLLYYQVETIILSLIKFIFSFFIFTVLIGFALSLWMQFIGRPIPSVTGQKKQYFKDSLIIGFTIPLIYAGLSVIINYIFIKIGLPVSPVLSNNPPGLDNLLPATATLSSIQAGIYILIFIIIILMVLLKLVKKQRYVIMLIIIFLILAAVPQNNSFNTYFISLLQSLLTFIQVYVLIKFVLRRNIFGYLMIIYAGTFYFGCLQFIYQPENFLKINGFILGGLTLLPLIIYFFYYRYRVY